MATPPKPAPDIGEILVRASVLSPEQLSQGHARAAGDRVRLEEALIDLGFVAEAVLLKVLSTQYKLQFVSSEKLSKTTVEKRTLALLSRQVAERYGVFPVSFDQSTLTLGVVTADPTDTELLRTVQEATQTGHVRPFLGRPRAVASAILRAYGGDLSAFAWMDLETHGQLYGYESVTRGQRIPADRPSASAFPPPLGASQPPPDVSYGTLSQQQALSLGTRRSQLPPAIGVDLGQLRAPAVPAFSSVAAPSMAGADALDGVVQVMTVLVGLIEADRPGLRGHSAQVARLVRRVAERMPAARSSIAAYVAAAHAHDLGKAGQYHLTSLNASEYETHRAAAQALVETPTRLLESVKLPRETADSLLSMYERFDGRGFPGTLAAQQIPLGARILAVADSYADLAQNPQNPFRRPLPAAEALEVLGKFARTIFDPDVLDTLRASL